MTTARFSVLYLLAHATPLLLFEIYVCNALIYDRGRRASVKSASLVTKGGGWSGRNRFGQHGIQFRSMRTRVLDRTPIVPLCRFTSISFLAFVELLRYSPSVGGQVRIQPVKHHVSLSDRLDSHRGRRARQNN